MMEAHIWTTANLSLEIKLLPESKRSFSDFLLTAERHLSTQMWWIYKACAERCETPGAISTELLKGNADNNYYFKQVFAICHDDTWRPDKP